MDELVGKENEPIFARKSTPQNLLDAKYLQKETPSFYKGGHTKTNNCAVCDILAQTGSLQIHIRSFHEGKEPYSCKICDNSCLLNTTSFKTTKNKQNSPKNEQENKNPIVLDGRKPCKDKIYKCKICTFSCLSMSKLSKHLSKMKTESIAKKE